MARDREGLAKRFVTPWRPSGSSARSPSSPPPSFSSSDQTSSIPISPSLHPRGRHDPSRFFSLVEHELSTALIEYRPRVYVDGTPVPMGLSGNAVIIATASISRFKFGFVPRVISSCESDGRWWWNIEGSDESGRVNGESSLYLNAKIKSALAWN